MKTFVVAKVFVVNDAGEILTLRRSMTDERRPGEVDFPGGSVDADEDMMAAAKRETHEEAGLEVTDLELVFAQTDLTPHGSGTWLTFLTHIQGEPEIRLSFEHDAFEWMKPDQVLEVLTYERQRKMLCHVIDNELL